MTLHDFLNLLNSTNEATRVCGIFWSTNLGLITSATIFICACINIWHPGIDDNWFDRIWYSLVAITVLCAFLVGIDPTTNPTNIAKTLFVLLAFRFVAEVVIRHWRYRITGKRQKTLSPRK